MHERSVPIPDSEPTFVRLWERWGPWVMALAFVASTFTLMNLKHDAFNTRVYDFARFTQAIWNTLHGRPLFTTITYGSILGNHFSPLLALASPLLWITGSERALFLVQAVNAAATGLILYALMREKYPKAAPWFLLAFYLNPALHDVTLFEVRRIVFGMPFLSLGLYGLATRRRGLMLLGLGVALLAKESVSLYVFMIGFYLLVFRRERWWGAGLMVFGALWFVGISLWVIPKFSAAGGNMFVYPQLYYFDQLGDDYLSILTTIVSMPFQIVKQMLGTTQLLAIGRILLPLGLVLPFLEPRWVLLCVPYVATMFLSSDLDMIGLGKWYPATILPVLFAAIAVGWERVPKRWERPAIIGLLATTVVGYALFSPAPLGGHFEASAYTVTPHDRLASTLLKTVSPEAKVAAQVPYVPHLALRSDVYHYPWIRIGEDAIDTFVLDRHAEAYPFDQAGINEAIDRLVADPTLVVTAEADGIYIIDRGVAQLVAYPVNRTAEGTIHLDRVEVAVADDQGIYHNQTDPSPALQPGQSVRVTLYWEALAPPDAERTVSVRIANPEGALLAQHDGLPGGGSKPTSWWETGWRFRDVYYLKLPADATAGVASLDLVLYDTFTLDVVPFEGSPPEDQGILHLLPLTIG